MTLYLIISIIVGMVLAYGWNTHTFADLLAKTLMSLYTIYGVVMLLNHLFPGSLVLANGMRLI